MAQDAAFLTNSQENSPEALIVMLSCLLFPTSVWVPS